MRSNVHNHLTNARSIRSPGTVRKIAPSVEARLPRPESHLTHLARFEYCLGLGDVRRRLQCHLLLALAVEHAEEVVVRASHDVRVAAVPATLELVENVVVLV